MSAAFDAGTRLDEARLAVVTSGLPRPFGGRSAEGMAADGMAADGSQAHELAEWARQERLDGLLWHAVANAELAGRLAPADDGSDETPAEPCAGAPDAPVPGPLADPARDAHLAGLRSSLAAEATAATAVDVLRCAGLDAFVFKGLANAHLDYPKPAWRTFFDADLLVPRADFADAIQVLHAAGFTRGTPPLRIRWEHRFARAAELRSPAGVELDLHAALATGYFGEVLDHDALRANPVSVRLGDVDCPAFCAAARLLISSYAIVLSRGPGLRLYRDLAQQLLVAGADWQAAARLAGDGAAVLAAGLLRMGRTLGVDHEAIEWAAGVTPSPTAARALAYASDAHHQGWSADARSTMLALGPSERIRFLAGVVIPSRANLRARGRTIRSHVVRGGGDRADDR